MVINARRWNPNSPFFRTVPIERGDDILNSYIIHG